MIENWMGWTAVTTRLVEMGGSEVIEAAEEQRRKRRRPRSPAWRQQWQWRTQNRWPPWGKKKKETRKSRVAILVAIPPYAKSKSQGKDAAEKTSVLRASAKAFVPNAT